jgi:hypothetical protein
VWIYENFELELEWRHLKSGGNAGVFLWSDPLPPPGTPFPRGMEVQVLDVGVSFPQPAKTLLPMLLPNGDEAVGADGKPKQEEVLDAGDSGIYLRGSSKSQVNIWCWPAGSGEVYGYRTDRRMPPEVRAAVTPKKRADKPVGQWNRFIITMRGDRLTVNLNGETVIENAQLPGVPARGPLALQHHGDPIEFANLFIRELPSQKPAPRIAMLWSSVRGDRKTR